MRGGERGAAPPGIWRFGDAELDEGEGRLRVAGSARPLDRSSLHVLRHLLENAGKVVTKDELLEAGWPGRLVAENSLAKAVSRLRGALGDSAAIRAVHGYGYRLARAARYEPVAATAPGPNRRGPQPGDVLPGPAGWQLLRRLGEGSTGVTFLARSPGAGERVIKVATDAAGVRGLRREVALARYIQDAAAGQAHVAPVLGCNLEEPPCYLELPHYPDGNLRDWIQARGGAAALDEAQRLALCVGLCEAVAAVHDLGIIHRDLKPENMYPVANGDGWRMVLADLGAGEAMLSPQLAGSLPSLSLAANAEGRQSPVAGSLLYIAPEVMAGEAATQRSDLYAIGVLVFQLLAGDLRGALGPGWEARIADPLLREDIAQAAATDPQQRTLDARALATRLRALDARRAERQRRQLRKQEARLQAGRRRRELRRRRFGLAVTLSLGVALLAITGVYLEAEQRRRQAEAAAAQREAMLAFVTGDILGQADPYGEHSGGGTDSGVRAAIDRAARRVDRRLQSDPLAAAAVHAVLGSIYFAQDAHERAIAHLEKARAYSQAAGAADPGGLVQVETTLCDVHRIGGNLPAAEEACMGALERARRAGSHEALATLKLAQLRGEQGRHEESRGLLGPLLESGALGTDPRLNGELYWALGLSARALGDYAAAHQYFLRLLEVAQTMGDRSSWLGWAYNSLGSVLVETGQYEEAEAMLLRAHEVFERTQGADQIEAQMPQAWRAEIRLRRGQWDEAAAILLGIRRAWAGHLHARHPLQQRASASLAWADAMAGRISEASAALAVAPRRDDPGRLPGDRTGAARTLRWTHVALALGELERAAELLDLFEQEERPGLPDTHPLRAEGQCLRAEWATRQAGSAAVPSATSSCQAAFARLDPRVEPPVASATMPTALARPPAP